MFIMVLSFYVYCSDGVYMFIMVLSLYIVCLLQ